MALIKCKECGNEVSDTAKACPHCGANVPKSSGYVAIIVIVIAGFFLLVTCSDKSKNTSSTALSSSGNRLSKSPEDITAECFAMAGLREDDSSHKVTPDEMNKVLECSSRYIKK
jgi:hypothetical protein